MTPLPKNPVRLYNSLEDIESSVPYATEDADELERVVSRFVSFARMLVVHQNMTDPFGKRNTDHIELATDLQKAMKNRRYSIVVLPMSKYFAAKMVTVLFRSLSSGAAA